MGITSISQANGKLLRAPSGSPEEIPSPVALQAIAPGVTGPSSGSRFPSDQQALVLDAMMRKLREPLEAMAALRRPVRRTRRVRGNDSPRIASPGLA